MVSQYEMSERSVRREVLVPASTVAVAGGSGFCLGLCSDGTTWAVGDNRCGQLGERDTTFWTQPAAVPGLTRATAVAAGSKHSLFIVVNRR